MGDMISGDALIYLFSSRKVARNLREIRDRESPCNFLAIMRKQADVAGRQRPRGLLEGAGWRSSGLAGPYGGEGMVRRK